MTTNPFGDPGSDSGDDDFEVDMGEEGGAPVPAGIYQIRVVDVETGVSKAGNPMWTWTWAITGDENGKETECEGKELKLWTALTPAAMWKLAETVKALGIPITDNKIKCKKADIVGKSCKAVVEESEYNGRPTSSLSKCLPL